MEEKNSFDLVPTNTSNKNSLDIYANIIVQQYTCVAKEADADVILTPQQLLVKLCTAEPPTTERVDLFVESLESKNIKLSILKGQGNFELVYLLKEKN